MLPTPVHILLCNIARTCWTLGYGCAYLAAMPIRSCLLYRALPSVFVLMLGGVAWAQPSTFTIHVNDDVVGQVRVSRGLVDTRTVYSMVSMSEVTVVWPQVIHTSMITEYSGERITACKSSVHVNGAVRDSSHMRVYHTGLVGFVHPGRTVTTPCTNAWSTARMYFEEPVGQRRIYVESVLDECVLEPLGGGRYKLIMPDRKVNFYTYRGGVLQEILVDRTFFDLVFRRV
jgi:hypothetical protein